jgi:hypothetical protein
MLIEWPEDLIEEGSAFGGGAGGKASLSVILCARHNRC